jgi:hypothetical protein
LFHQNDFPREVIHDVSRRSQQEYATPRLLAEG